MRGDRRYKIKAQVEGLLWLGLFLWLVYMASQINKKGGELTQTRRAYRGG